MKNSFDLTGPPAQMDMKRSMSADEYRFVRGLVDGKPLKELAEECGVTLAYAQRLARSSRLLVAVSEEMLYQCASAHYPAAVRLVRAVMDGLLPGAEKQTNRSSDVYIKPETRLAAAKIFLDMAQPQLPTRQKGSDADLTEMDPDELRAFISQAESMLADKATPVNAQDSADTPQRPDDMSSYISMLGDD